MNNIEQVPKSPETIQFRIIEIKKINYVRNDYLQFGYGLNDIINGEVKIGVKLELEPNHETFSIFLNMEYVKEENLLFGVESLHKYHIINFKNALKFQDNGQYQVNDEVMKLWLQVAINDTRGMLVILNSDHEYSKIIFPLIDLNAFIQSLKGNKSEDVKQSDPEIK